MISLNIMNLTPKPIYERHVDLSSHICISLKSKGRDLNKNNSILTWLGLFLFM